MKSTSKTDPRRNRGADLLRFVVPAFLVCLPILSWGQAVLPPEAVKQFQQVVGDRVEAVSILAGDYAAAGGIYSFRGGSIADLSVTKIGGGGEVGAPRPLGIAGLQWAPVLLGNVGLVSAENTFTSGFLAGNRTIYDTFAVQGGGGAALYLTDNLRLKPTISGIYGRVENTFESRNANGDLVNSVGQGTLVGWTMDTWSIVPAVELEYEVTWRRTIFNFSSRYTFFHTESFDSSTPILGVQGDSSTWENKVDADVPLGLSLFGLEFRSGGFFSRTEVYGHAAQGLNADYVYTANGRLVLDVLGKVWKVRWVGLGASYVWGRHFEGWTAGLDLRFQF